eukprot:8758039-Alexandrium_andersonii.AAC.1
MCIRDSPSPASFNCAPVVLEGWVALEGLRLEARVPELLDASSASLPHNADLELPLTSIVQGME